MNDSNFTRRTFLGGAAALGASAALPPAGLIGTAEATSQNGGESDREVVLITGTSSGFGNLIALTLGRQGYEVYASMRHLRDKNASAAKQLERIARDEQLSLDVVEIDVRRERSVASGVQQVLRRAGRVDVLVNNAGIFYPALLETLTIADVEEVFDTNVFGQLRMNRAVLPAMRARGEGLVVQITSGTGRLALPFQGAYNGAKWAMEAMAQVSRYELSQSGVDVVIVEPGPYPTDLIDNARIYYRDYLRGLTRADGQRRVEYAELATRVERELQEEGPDPPGGRGRSRPADRDPRRSAAAPHAGRRADLPAPRRLQRHAPTATADRRRRGPARRAPVNQVCRPLSRSLNVQRSRQGDGVAAGLRSRVLAS